MAEVKDGFSEAGEDDRIKSLARSAGWSAEDTLWDACQSVLGKRQRTKQEHEEYEEAGDHRAKPRREMRPETNITSAAKRSSEEEYIEETDGIFRQWRHFTRTRRIMPEARGLRVAARRRRNESARSDWEHKRYMAEEGDMSDSGYDSDRILRLERDTDEEEDASDSLSGSEQGRLCYRHPTPTPFLRPPPGAHLVIGWHVVRRIYTIHPRSGKCSEKSIKHLGFCTTDDGAKIRAQLDFYHQYQRLFSGPKERALLSRSCEGFLHHLLPLKDAPKMEWSKRYSVKALTFTGEDGVTLTIGYWRDYHPECLLEERQFRNRRT